MPPGCLRLPRSRSTPSADRRRPCRRRLQWPARSANGADPHRTDWRPVAGRASETAVYVRNEKHLYKDFIVARHELTFHQSDFADIASQLKNVFGVTLINESQNKAWRFNGSFKNATAKEIIENICLIKNLSPVEKGDTIFIK